MRYFELIQFDNIRLEDYEGVYDGVWREEALQVGHLVGKIVHC